MGFVLDAACGCSAGPVRKENTDNFYFDDRCLPADNQGLRHPVTMSRELGREVCLAVFDGRGEAGRAAAFLAACGFRDRMRCGQDFVFPERHFLQDTCALINTAIREKAAELGADQTGATVAALYFTADTAYVCSLGDSRVYQLRDRVFFQISRDHRERTGGRSDREGEPTLYLGLDPEKYQVCPHVAKGELQKGDRYLICTDGLTDTLCNMDLAAVLQEEKTPSDCVRRLIRLAEERGVADNVTVVVGDIR